MRCGLIGRRLPHSYSPQIHALLGDYSYDLFELEPDEVVSFVKNGNYDACNVTIPYKKTVMPALDFIDDAARKIGSVNTIVKRDGRLLGYNTDYFGFKRMIESAGFDPQGKKCVVLGSGGTSLTANAVLKDMGASSVVTVSRGGEDNYSNVSRHFDASLVVNCTPVGMYPNNLESPLSLDGFDSLELVCDVIYNPAKTLLMLEAQERGIKTVGGLLMLVAQAKRASELFTGTGLPDGVIDRVTAKLDFEMKNVTLVGMPGCGKSSVGRALGSLLNRDFADTDEIFRETYSMTAGDYITKHGEKAFREKETEVMKTLGKEKSLVIATGGGLLKTREAALAARQNSVVVFIKRDLDKLPTNGRPLSAQGVEALWEQRKPLYEKYSDVTVTADTTAAECAEKIAEMLKK